jgi:integrase
MTDIASAFLHDPRTRRALELDTLAAILPIDRRDRLAELLTDDDVETLKHLAREGMGENTLRALASDLAYLEAWALAATGAPLAWPAAEALALKFVAHHLWDPGKCEADDRHGMPADVGDALRANGLLRTKGPHAPDTVRRRLASWSTMHRWRGLEGPFASPALRSALRLAVRASGRPRRRKSERAVTRDILDRLTATCRSNELVDVRDLAILMAAFGSGGRRRSEIAGLRLEQLRDDPPVLSDPTDPTSTPLPCLSVRLGRTKTTEANDDAKALMIGPPAAALKAWIARAKIARGPVFRHRPLGNARGTGAEPAIGEPDRQAPLRRRRVGPAGVLGAWAALGLSHRGVPPGGVAAGSHAAVPTWIRPTGGQLLQRRGSDKGQGRAVGDLNGEFRGHHSRGVLELAAANSATAGRAGHRC